MFVWVQLPLPVRMFGRSKLCREYYEKTLLKIKLNSRTWPFRLSVRTFGFQPKKRGSIPLSATILET